MTRSMPRIISLAAVVLALGAGTAHATVYFGHPITVVRAGALSKARCDPAAGCLQAVVMLRYRHHHALHLVRCAHPRFLRVVRAFTAQGDSWAVVYACRRTYRWRLPR